MGEECFLTEWKQGKTPKEKSGNPAFGGVFFYLLQLTVSALLMVS